MASLGGYCARSGAGTRSGTRTCACARSGCFAGPCPGARAGSCPRACSGTGPCARSGRSSGTVDRAHRCSWQRRERRHRR